jgi:hypothetical protein
MIDDWFVVEHMNRADPSRIGHAFGDDPEHVVQGPSSHLTGRRRRRTLREPAKTARDRL